MVGMLYYVFFIKFAFTGPYIICRSLFLPGVRPDVFLGHVSFLQFL